MRIENYEDLKGELGANAEDEYREFSAKLTLTKRPFLGVRIPKLREIARAIPLDRSEEFLRVEPVAFEEVVVRGFLICRLPYQQMLKWFDSQVDYIDNWSACDVFCSGLRPVIRKHRVEFLDLKIEKLLKDPREFAIRTGLVLLKCSYVDFDYLAVIFDRVEELRGREEYYVKMAIAWLVCECFIKFPEETFGYLRVSRLPKWTFNKAISKICDSHRVAPEAKEMLRKLRK